MSNTTSGQPADDPEYSESELLAARVANVVEDVGAALLGVADYVRRAAVEDATARVAAAEARNARLAGARAFLRANPEAAK